MRYPHEGPEKQSWVARLLWRQRRTRLALSAAVGAVAAAITVVVGNWLFAPAIGWDATAIVFTSTVWLGIWPLSAQTTAARATREDPAGRRATSSPCARPWPASPPSPSCWSAPTQRTA